MRRVSPGVALVQAPGGDLAHPVAMFVSYLPTMIGIFTVVVIVVVAGLLLFVMLHPRPTLDHLYDIPDDLKRADDNQRPPFDGSAGWAPPPT
jgi:hypothetical protein